MAPNASSYLSTPIHTIPNSNPPLPPIPPAIPLKRPTTDETISQSHTNSSSPVPDKPHLGKFVQSISTNESISKTNFIHTHTINESDHQPTSMNRLGTALRHNPCNNNETGSTPTNQHGTPPSTPIANIWPNNSLALIHKLVTMPSREITTSNFIFEPTTVAANHNSRYLRSFEFDISKALATESSSFTAPGSEFRHWSDLHPLLRRHPLWSRLKTHLSTGIKFPLLPLSHSTRRLDLHTALDFGNHKGVDKFPTFYDKLNSTDVTNGFSIPIPKQDILRIPGALACPMNVIEQLTISETGELMDKQRACHDLSFPMEPSNTSVNSRVIQEELPPCMFGYCLLRIIHYIAALRLQYPQQPILIQKVDWKSAYKRIHLHHDTAIQCCSIYNDLALIPLRAIFGGAPCPSEWGIISETTADLANHILNHPDWDPIEMHSPNQHLIAEPKILDDSTPFGCAHPLMVHIPIEPVGKSDVYIDDTVTISLHSDTNNPKASAAVPLAIHTLGRPLLSTEPISRSDLLCLRKLLAEGRLEEVKNTLGWDIDTRTFSVKLPTHKFTAWNLSITNMLKAGSTSFSSLETLIGRLNHLSVILPHVLHFMGRIRKLCLSASKRRSVKLSLVHKEDLTLLQKYLQKTHTGININMITFRQPTHAFFSDACPAGMGGYNDHGKAWRWAIPSHLQRRANINMLEHVASVIGPWIDILSDDLPPHSCSISMTNNTTSAGWLRKSNFAETGENAPHLLAKLQVARSHANRFIDHDIKEYSQWFPGKANLIADALSRDFHLSNTQLTTLVRFSLPHQNRQLFYIAPLPQKIVCWLCAWLQQLPANHLSPEAHQPSSLRPGIDGNNFFNPLIFPTTHTYNPSVAMTESSSYPHSHTPYAQPSSLSQIFIDWVKTQCAIPSTMWLRPSGTFNTPTHDSTPTENLHAFYRPNIKVTEPQIHHRNNKKHCPDAFSSAYTNTTKPIEHVQ